MEDKIEDGGFAFPCGPDDKSGWSAEYGMTLRDWFAGQALAAFGASFLGAGWHNPSEYQLEVMTKGAYQAADAMIKARKGAA